MFKSSLIMSGWVLEFYKWYPKDLQLLIRDYYCSILILKINKVLIKAINKIYWEYLINIYKNDKNVLLQR